MTRTNSFLLVLTAILLTLACMPQAADPEPGGSSAPEPIARGIELERLSWLEAEEVLTAEAVVVIPLGARLKEHGPHLPLNNDWLMAEYFKQRILEAEEVIMLPTLDYHFYPAFHEYPGSVSLSLDTARDLVVDLVTSLAAFGPRRFYVINTGVSTEKALQPAAELLAEQGVLLSYSRLSDLEPVIEQVAEQAGGSHADEIETSMMLYIAADAVDMSQAVKDYDPRPLPGLSRIPDSGRTYSPTGVWGDPTLATHDKGHTLVEARVASIRDDIQALRTVALPR